MLTIRIAIISMCVSIGWSESSAGAGGGGGRHRRRSGGAALDASLLLAAAAAAASGAAASGEASVLGGAAAPSFDRTATRNVTALAGRTAYLGCRVRNLANRTVSWIRHRDLHLLTAGVATYTSDGRFSAITNRGTGDWTLRIRFAQRRDSGVYECQVGTTPPIGLQLYLNVVEPVTEVIGAPEVFLNRGSTLNVTCIVRHSPEPPPHIRWTHDDQEINYDSERGGVSVITEKGEQTVSTLLVQRAREGDSGRYTCRPSNADPKSLHVHVLSGEHPAAMQHGGQLKLEYPLSFLLLSMLATLVGH